MTLLGKRRFSSNENTLFDCESSVDGNLDSINPSKIRKIDNYVNEVETPILNVGLKRKYLHLEDSFEKNIPVKIQTPPNGIPAQNLQLMVYEKMDIEEEKPMQMQFLPIRYYGQHILDKAARDVAMATSKTFALVPYKPTSNYNQTMLYENVESLHQK